MRNAAQRTSAAGWRASASSLLRMAVPVAGSARRRRSSISATAWSDSRSPPKRASQITWWNVASSDEAMRARAEGLASERTSFGSFTRGEKAPSGRSHPPFSGQKEASAGFPSQRRG